MITPPSYFSDIRERAQKRWEQLERDPELAGPWHQLFKQVQSPRHVLSELLQNADDAGATEASVMLSGEYFVFSHNGEDFTEEHFTSLCRFGYSNKRALHTIGFRGIGFKSTFSLGDAVELYTPTLSVSFIRSRFTEPAWKENPIDTKGKTLIRVKIAGPNRKKEIEKNLQDWVDSPISLLFFRHIRHIKINDREICWENQKPGPVPDSQWVSLLDNPDKTFLVVRSQPESFPEDALDEIRQERLLGIDQEMEFPPCKVEIVVGAKGRLHVVLPTGVETDLPFACNAPFIQDPARLKIKDPETSPTNQWLQERTGQLAANVMLHWLNRTELTLSERSEAYKLFPDVDREDNSLEGNCGRIVEEAFESALENSRFLLTHTGELQPDQEAVIIPQQLYEVWPVEQTAKLFDKAGRPPLSHHISGTDRNKLIRWNAVSQIDIDHILKTLESEHLPKPETWRQLLALWAYIAPEVTRYRYGTNREHLRIVPTQGKDVLYSSSEVVRLGEKRLLQSEADWQFLAEYLLVLNQNWLRFLSEQRRIANEHNNEELRHKIESAFDVLDVIGLNDTSDASNVIELVAKEFFSQKNIQLPQCIQLAQIAAKLGATTGKSFRFITSDLRRRARDYVILFNSDGRLDSFFKLDWYSSHFLHSDYSRSFTSCSSEEWRNWVSSGRSGLHGFVPPVSISTSIWNRKNAERELARRGLNTAPFYPYKTESFRIEDWDFDEIHWRHWKSISQKDPDIWSRIVEHILNQSTGWERFSNARLLQIATTGTVKPATYAPIPPTWILKLRDLLCLRDTRGISCKPSDLLLRTPETEPLMDVERFVHARLDTEANRALLQLLGASDEPTGPDRILDCLRTLAKSANPPVREVEKWYRRLDQLLDTCSTDDLNGIRQAFHDEKIILTEDMCWTTSSGVFLSPDEQDVPGVALVRATVRDFMLWHRIGVTERPTADRAIQWLKELSSGERLSQDDTRRVRALLARYPIRIWNECGHWLNLAGEWLPVEKFAYSLSMQSLVAWKHLHEWVKQKTADLQNLPAETTEAFPFSALSPLAAHIEDRFHRPASFKAQTERREWLNQLGLALQRIELEDEAETLRIRNLAATLAETAWQTTQGLEIIPYIDGTPAGTPRRAEAVWLGKILYIENASPARLAPAVSQELGRAFRKQEISEAIKFCFDRSSEFVTEYVQENFKLSQDPPTMPLPFEETARKTDMETTPPADLMPITPSTEAEATTNFETGDSDNSDDTPDERGKYGGNDSATIPLTKDVREHTKPPKPSNIERFALAQGFKKDSDGRFFHPNGGWIARTGNLPFPWERRTREADLVRYYFPKDHCLQREPLQLPAEIWGLLKESPDLYALILSDLRDEPVEIPGTTLCQLCDNGEIKLYPATYRLVLEQN